jgi:O-antigen ligase/polysaccharide polymerase Wzy-like membrane protein
VSTVLLCATVALLPLLVPRGPGNSAPADLFAAGFVVLTLLALLQRGRRLEVPAPFALVLVLAGSLLGLALGGPSATGWLTLAVDLYLALLLVAIVNHLRGDERALRLVLAVWTAAALAWAALLVCAHYRIMPAELARSLQVPVGTNRAAGPARDNPNLAGSYLMVSFFVLLASGWPRRGPLRPARLLAGGLLLLALFATGSLGGLLGLVAGCLALAVGAYLRGGRGRREVQALAGAALLAGALAMATLLVVVGLPRDGLAEVRTVSERAKGGVLQQTVGRAGESLAGRIELWSAAIARAGPRALVGVGPGEAKAELRITTGSRARDGTLELKSLHNDYLAFAVERGLLGLAGLLALYAAMLRRGLRLVVAGPWRGVGVAGLGAAVVGTAADSLFHEVLHFRHAIVLFALVWVAGEVVRPAAGAPSAAPDAVGSRHGAG